MPDPHVDINVGVKDDASTKLDKIAQSFRQMKKENALSGERALGSAFRGGVGGGVADFAIDSLGLGVGGVVAQAAATSIKGMGDALADVRREYVETGSAAGALTDKFAASIPILGSLFEAGQSVREAFTGERLALTLLNQETEIYNKLMNAKIAAAKAYKNIQAGVVASLASMQNQIDIANTDDPFQKSKLGARGQTAERAESLKKSAESDIANIKKEFDESTKQQVLLANKLRETFRNDWGTDVDDFTAKIDDPAKAAKLARDKAAIAKADQTVSTMLSQRNAAVDARKAGLDDQLGMNSNLGTSLIEEAMRKRRTDQLKELDETSKQKKEQDERAFKETEDRLKQQRRDQLDMLREAGDAESELRQKELQAEGKDLDARLEQIRQHYADRIELARSPEARAALAASQELDIAAARRGSVSYRLSLMSSSREDRFGSGANEAMRSQISNVYKPGDGLQERAIKAAEESSKASKNVADKLSAYIDQLKNTALEVCSAFTSKMPV